MTPKAQRIAIAEVCGFSNIHVSEFDGRVIGDDREGNGCIAVPDYLNDLNAMHEAEKVLTENQVLDYLLNIEVVTGTRDGWSSIHATAAQRAEAFLQTLNLWKDAAYPQPLAMASRLYL